jgi:hypothetical protein
VRDVRASASLHRQRRSRVTVVLAEARALLRPIERARRKIAIVPSADCPPRRVAPRALPLRHAIANNGPLSLSAHAMSPSSIHPRAATSVTLALSAALRASSECDAQQQPAPALAAHEPRSIGGGVGVASGTGHRWWIAPTSCGRGASAMSLRVSLRTRAGCDARRERCERSIAVRINRCSGPPLAFRAVELRSGPNVWIHEHRDDIDLRRGEAFGIETSVPSTLRAGVVIVTIERGGRVESIRRPISLR